MQTYLVWRLRTIDPTYVNGVPFGDPTIVIDGPYVKQADTEEGAIQDVATDQQSMGDYVAVEVTPFSIQLTSARRRTPLLPVKGPGAVGLSAVDDEGGGEN